MDIIQRNTIALLRTSLFNAPIGIEPMTEKQWQKLFTNTKEHAVTALCFDALSLIPSNLQPPRELLFQWAMYANDTENNFQKRKEVAAKLTAAMRNDGVNILVIKGFSVAKYYPQPAHRESCDLDIVSFDGFHKVNVFVGSRGVSVDCHNERHSVFTIEGVMIENHSRFLYNRDSDELRMEKFLETEGLKSCAEATTKPVALCQPLANALFFLKHAEQHFVYSLPGRLSIELRTLCDWAILLNSKSFNYIDLKHLIQGTSIDIFADLLTRVCIKTFGLSDSWENNLHSIPDKIVNQCQRLIVAYKNPNENRHDFVGKSTRFIKYLRYSKFFRFVFSRSIFANYYSFFRKNSNGHIDVKSENSE